MLKELIDKFYLEREKAKDKIQVKFYITDAGRCPRAAFFKLKNAPRGELEARILRLFEHGDYIHRLILNTLFSLSLVRSSEINIPPQEIVSGRADAIISWEKELYVLDVKSMNSFIFKNLSSPKEENIDQLQLYLHFFKIEKGILLYVNKDTQELKEYVLGYDPARCESLLKKLEELKEKVEAGVIPSRLAGYPANKECQFCQFKEICSRAQAGEMNWEEFKKQLSP